MSVYITARAPTNKSYYKPNYTTFPLNLELVSSSVKFVNKMWRKCLKCIRCRDNLTKQYPRYNLCPLALGPAAV